MPNEARISNDTDEHESADYYVCVRASEKSLFSDDMYDFCCEKVRYRPHGPVAPKKICLECALPSMTAASKAGELNVVTTPKCAEEFRQETGKIILPSDGD